MKGLIKLGVLVAAGYGTYEILRRTGALQKAGNWLSENIPDEVKNRVHEVSGQVMETVHDVEGRVGQTWSNVVDQAGQIVGRTKEAAPAAAAVSEVANAVKNGRIETTGDGTGESVSHKVGRGVVQ